jgi:Domain of unknown function (DUF4389)
VVGTRRVTFINQTYQRADAFYSYSALGTDRYPPFTLKPIPDYPARLEVEYPEHLSRGLVLVKWWLLAIPHYIVVAFFDGGFGRFWGPGLIGVLVVFAAVVLLFKHRYPRDMFDLHMGMNRWTFRVVAYAALMRDEYPPFRLDIGPTERSLDDGAASPEITEAPVQPGSGKIAGRFAPSKLPSPLR